MVESGTNTEADNFSFVGGELCLDFANTVGQHVPILRNERLVRYDDLVAWARSAGILTEDDARRLLGEAERRPEEAMAVFDRAHNLREAIYHVFAALYEGQQADDEYLGTLNAELLRAMGHSQVALRADGYAWGWEERKDDRDMDRILWPIVRSAADLLTSEEKIKVSQCAGDTCNWLFLDMSRNHSRHWCDMRDCGNRAKARRHYHRRREA